MGNIYRDRQEITVPESATADRNSKEVSVYYKDPSTGRRRRYIIGQLLPNGNMYPNDNFRMHHADYWVQAYCPDNHQEQILSV